MAKRQHVTESSSLWPNHLKEYPRTIQFRSVRLAEEGWRTAVQAIHEHLSTVRPDHDEAMFFVGMSKNAWAFVHLILESSSASLWSIYPRTSKTSCIIWSLLWIHWSYLTYKWQWSLFIGTCRFTARNPDCCHLNSSVCLENEGWLIEETKPPKHILSMGKVCRKWDSSALRSHFRRS